MSLVGQIKNLRKEKISVKKINSKKTKEKKDDRAEKKIRESKKSDSLFSKITRFFGCFDSYTEDSLILDTVNSLADRSQKSDSATLDSDDSKKALAGDYSGDTSVNQTAIEAADDSLSSPWDKHSAIRNRFIRPVKFRITSSKDKSFSKKAFVAFADYMYSAKVSSYGAFIFIFSVIAAILIVAKAIISGADLYSVDRTDAVFVLISMISSLSLFIRGGRCLADSIQSSRICSFILFNWLGVNKESVRSNQKREPEHFVFILGGIIFGILTLLISPLQLFYLFLRCIVLLIIFHSPESGCVLAFFVLPIFPTQSFIILMIQTVISYFCKVFICKRSFKPSATDITVFIFGSTFLIASIFYSGKIFAQGFMYLFAISCFILISMLIKNSEWVYRCVKTIRFSSVMLSIVLILSSLKTILNELIPFEIAGYISDFIPQNFYLDESKKMYILFGAFFTVSGLLSRNSENIKPSDRIFTLITAISVLLSRSPLLIVCFFAVCLFLSVRKNLKNIIYGLLIPGALIALMIIFIPDVFETIISFCGFTSEYFTSHFANIVSSCKIAMSSIIDIKGLSVERIVILLEKNLPDSISAIAEGSGLYFGTISRTGILSLLTFLFVVLLLISDYYVWGKSKKSNVKLRIVAFSGLLTLVEILILGLFVYPFANIIDTAYIFLLLGLMYATCNVMKDERNGEIELPERAYSLGTADIK